MEKKPQPSYQQKGIQPAPFFWTVSSSAVLDMLNSSQLTPAEETNYEITTENRIQHSMQK